MKKYNSLDEVRFSIDEVDDKIINLIVKRKQLVVEAVKLKNRDQIVDQKRIDEILTDLKKKAKVKNLPDGLVEKLWKAMIEEFIRYEREFFDEIHEHKKG